MSDFHLIFDFIRDLYNNQDQFIALHEPKFIGNEKQYLAECIDSGFVSSVGEFVNRFEKEIAHFCGSNYAIATSNGTSALHALLHALEINQNHEVITQSLSFIATSNAIAYTGANPIYIDIDLESLSMCPKALEEFLKQNAIKQGHQTINKTTKKMIKACLPMHTFGHPARMQEIQEICHEWNLLLVEDCAESLGSYHIINEEKIHTGLSGIGSILSFNGNKTITAGGGGVILTNDEKLAKLLKHITTTAKLPHPYEYDHNMLGFNYRLPNLNAALVLAQLEQLPYFLRNKKETASIYRDFFNSLDIDFVWQREGTEPNFWLNAIILENKTQRDDFLTQSNSLGIMTRPIWKLNHQTPMFDRCQCGKLDNSYFLQDRLVNLPSGVRN